MDEQWPAFKIHLPVILTNERQALSSTLGTTVPLTLFPACPLATVSLARCTPIAQPH